ncbi:putative Major facilitator superfamily domain-containing protein [Seiridium cardinale]
MDAGYKMKWARVPSAPRRLVFNKTSITSILIDSFYLLLLPMLPDRMHQDWVYYINILVLVLCVARPIVGLLQCWTHRYSSMQIIGLGIKTIGMGILIDGDMATNYIAALVIAMVLVGFGGSMLVVGSRVTAQASVPTPRC